MAASFTIAARNNGFAKADTRAATLASVRAYREAMAAFAQMGTMDIWYAHLDEDELMAVDPQRGGRDGEAGEGGKKQRRRTSGQRRRRRPRKGGEAGEGGQAEEKAAKTAEKRAEKTAAKAHTRDSLQALSKLGELVDGKYRIVSQPPIVVPARDLAATYGLSPDEVVPGDPRAVPRLPGHPARRPAAPAGAVRDRGRGPQGGRRRQRRHPGVHRPAPGTRRAGPAVPAGQGGDGLGAGGPPAQEPVPAARRAGGAGAADDAGRQRHLPRLDQGAGRAPPLLLAPAARHEGLGGGRADDAGRAHVLRAASAGGRWRGPTPGPATRSPSPSTWATSDAFDQSITDFSERYADQNERDYQEFVKAVRSGRLEAVEGV